MTDHEELAKQTARNTNDISDIKGDIGNIKTDIGVTKTNVEWIKESVGDVKVHLTKLTDQGTKASFKLGGISVTHGLLLTVIAFILTSSIAAVFALIFKQQ